MLFSNFYLPIEIQKRTNAEYKMEDVIYTEEELIQNTVSKIEKELQTSIQHKNNIIDKRINTDRKDGYIEIEVIYEVLENIGVEDKIIF